MTRTPVPISKHAHVFRRTFLTPRQSSVIALQQEGLTLAQAAKALGISTTMTSAHLRKARQAVRGKTGKSIRPWPTPRVRQRQEIVEWVGRVLLPQFVMQGEQLFSTREIGNIIRKQFPQITERTAQKYYAEVLVRILIQRGILQKIGQAKRTRYRIQWPPKPPAK